MKKIIYFITLLFLVGCVDLSENMYNDLGKDRETRPHTDEIRRNNANSWK